ncbi:hypothetical protein [Streptacidiphilus sp. P02-A3a]|uniref:hypothetical protein n=1 Tax=Streptacidiphilus sp. P02-A3a TaxID=2704468 RepID=UPI0015FA9D6A|nr:hypothetical protein [Streptacidiphilus sp. P02-A3a]QMU71457.1 hypothetical protein GXP74_27705 [Streptacidiphilus sp. P02-A3a]
MGVVVLGSPWVERPLLETPSQNAFVSWLQDVVSAPEWHAPAGEAVGAAGQWSMLVGAATLVLGLLLIMPGLMTRAPAGRVRRAAAIGAGALIGATSGLLGWSVEAAFGHGLGESQSQLFVSFVPSSTVFGILLGVVTGLVFTRSDASAPHAGEAEARPQEGSSLIDTLADSSPAALGEVDGDVTRYLCVAAYLDPSFARTVVERLLGDPFGAVAASPGVDLRPVARHCLAARELRFRRDLKLLAVWTGIALIAPLWLLLAGVVLGVLSGRITDGPGRRGRPGPDDRGRGGPDVSASVRWIVITAVPLAVAVVLLGIGLSVLGLPGLQRWLLGAYLYGVPAVLALGVGLFAAHRVVAQEELDLDERLRTTLRRSNFQPEATPQPAPAASWVEDRLDAVAEAQQGNVTIYSGWSPFMGFSAPTSTWSLAIPLLPASHPLGAGPGRLIDFDAWDLVEQIRSCWQKLAEHQPEHEASERLSGLVVQDRVFVHGATIGGDPRFVPEAGSLLTTLEPEQVKQIALNPTGSARHWLTGYLPLWGGDVVSSLLLNISVSGQTVHVRWSRHILGPVRGRYHTIDALPTVLTAERRRVLGLAALQRTRSVLLSAPLAALGHTLFESRHRRRLLREWQAIGNDPGFDYGARFSAREAALNATYPNYYQPQDGERALNALDHHTLATICDFLEAHGVDITDLKQQQQTILNHGVIQQGGVSNVGNLAVGQGAKVSGPAPAASE